MRRCVYCFGEIERGERPRSESHKSCADYARKAPLPKEVLAARRRALGRLAAAPHNAMSAVEEMLALLLGELIDRNIERRRTAEGESGEVLP